MSNYDRVRHAFRLAVTIDETGGGSMLNDELIALLSSCLQDRDRTAILQEVTDEFSKRVDHFHPSSGTPRLKTLSLPPRSQRRRDFWLYAVGLAAFVAGGIMGYRAAELVHRTQPAGIPAPEAPITGAADAARAAAGAAVAANDTGGA